MENLLTNCKHKLLTLPLNHTHFNRTHKRSEVSELRVIKWICLFDAHLMINFLFIHHKSVELSLAHSMAALMDSAIVVYWDFSSMLSLWEQNDDF